MKLALFLLLCLALWQPVVTPGEWQQSGQRDAAPQGGVSAAADKAVGQTADAEPPRDSEGNRTYRPSQLDRRAKVLSRPAPHYPRRAMNRGVEGTVSLRLVLAASGKVEHVSVIKGLPEGVTEEAIKAARKIKFVPAEKDGRRVSQWATIQYNFGIDRD